MNLTEEEAKLLWDEAWKEYLRVVEESGLDHIRIIRRNMISEITITGVIVINHDGKSMGHEYFIKGSSAQDVAAELRSLKRELEILWKTSN